MVDQLQRVRNEALEEAAQACEQCYAGNGGPPDDPHPDAVLQNASVHECIERIRALQSQPAAPAEQPQEFPTGAIVNAQAFVGRLEAMYDFECQAGPLKNCTEWLELLRCLNVLTDYANGLPASPAQEAPTDRESVITCLGDDAAKMLQDDPDSEIAANMLAAARMLETQEESDGKIYERVSKAHETPELRAVVNEAYAIAAQEARTCTRCGEVNPAEIHTCTPTEAQQPTNPAPLSTNPTLSGKEAQQASELPPARGVSRDAGSPGGKAVLVAFDRALSDDELRTLHSLLAHRPTASGTDLLLENTKPGSTKERVLIQAAFNRHYPRPSIDQSLAFETGWAECRAAVTQGAADKSDAASLENVIDGIALQLAEDDGLETDEEKHQLIWEGCPPEPWGEVWQKYVPEAKRLVDAGLKYAKDYTAAADAAIRAEVKS